MIPRNWLPRAGSYFVVTVALRPPALTFLGELGEVLLQVQDLVSLQVAVKLEPGDSLLFREPGTGKQPVAADHLLQEPAARWRDTAGGRERKPRPRPGSPSAGVARSGHLDRADKVLPTFPPRCSTPLKSWWKQWNLSPEKCANP